MTAQAFRVTRATPGTNADVLVVQGRGPGDIPDDRIEVLETPGLRVHPAVRPTTEAIVFELSTGDRVAFVVDKSQRGGVVPEAGETQLRGDASPSTVVRLRASGDIEVTPAPGRNVILADGDQPFVRGTDYADALHAHLTALETTIAALGAALAAVNVYAQGIQATADPAPPHAATVALNAALATTLPPLLSTFATSVANFDTARTTYLSTRVVGL